MNTANSLAGASLSMVGAIATIQLDNPARRNAIDLAAWLKIPQLIRKAEAHPDVGLVIVRGANGHFSAGNDIAEMAALPGNPARALALGRAMATAMQVVEAASKPVIMAIEGSCYGASVALALAGDLRIAAENARFAITPAKLGAVYLQSDLHRLAASIGHGAAKDLIYLGEAIGAGRALEMGLIERILPHLNFEEELAAVCKTLLSGSQRTLRATKEMLRATGGGATPQETDETLRYFVDATQAEDFREGVTAFLQKRRPHFHRTGAE